MATQRVSNGRRRGEGTPLTPPNRASEVAGRTVSWRLREVTVLQRLTAVSILLFCAVVCGLLPRYCEFSLAKQYNVSARKSCTCYSTAHEKRCVQAAPRQRGSPGCTRLARTRLTGWNISVAPT